MFLKTKWPLQSGIFAPFNCCIKMSVCFSLIVITSFHFKVIIMITHLVKNTSNHPCKTFKIYLFCRTHVISSIYHVAHYWQQYLIIHCSLTYLSNTHFLFIHK